MIDLVPDGAGPTCKLQGDLPAPTRVVYQTGDDDSAATDADIHPVTTSGMWWVTVPQGSIVTFLFALPEAGTYKQFSVDAPNDDGPMWIEPSVYTNQLDNGG